VDRRRCHATLAFGRQSGLRVFPLLGPFLMAGSGKPITTHLHNINRSAAALFVSQPLPAPVRICGIPNVSLVVRPFLSHGSGGGGGGGGAPPFQLAALLFDVHPDGKAADLLTRGVRNVGRPSLTDPAKSHVGWDGPDAPFDVRMRALCVDVPQGHFLGLGLTLFDPGFLPASEDPALRVSVACGGPSRLDLPLVHGTVARPIEDSEPEQPAAK